VPAKGSSGYWPYVVYGTLYVLLMGGVVGGSVYARSWAISTYGSPQAQAQWNEWRAGAAKLSTEGPVKRRVPKSDQPPALVLATTYFGICLTITLILTTALYGATVYFVHGVLQSRPDVSLKSSSRHESARPSEP